MRALLRHAAPRNFLLNVLGNGVPMVAAMVALPVISREAGADRLGFLGLTWALIGYFGVLDLGLSRVITRHVAIAEGQGQVTAQRELVMRLGRRLFLIVAAVAFVLALIVPASWVAGSGANPGFISEARVALNILWLTLPATVVTGLMRGALEGRQLFGQVNLLRIVFGVWSFAAPLVTLHWGHTLPALTLSVAAGRFLSLVAHYWLARRALAGPPDRGAVSLAVWPLVREGGWLTVSNAVGPLMVTFDRFAIAGLLSLTAAAYYFVPQEIALRMLFVPGALAATIFPMIARLGQHVDSTAQARISHTALLAAVIVSLPICLLLASASRPLLRIWMGPLFAEESAPVAAVFAIGLFANCAAQVPFSWIQAAGRADVTGKLHLVQLPIYVLVLYGLTWRYGIAGAAWAWTLRASADCALLLSCAHKLFPAGASTEGIHALVAGALLVTSLAAGATWLVGPPYWLVLVVGVMIALALFQRWSRSLRIIVQGSEVS